MLERSSRGPPGGRPGTRLPAAAAAGGALRAPPVPPGARRPAAGPVPRPSALWARSSELGLRHTYHRALTGERPGQPCRGRKPVPGLSLFELPSRNENGQGASRLRKR